MILYDRDFNLFILEEKEFFEISIDNTRELELSSMSNPVTEFPLFY